jgi:hypothetical protein
MLVNETASNAKSGIKSRKLFSSAQTLIRQVNISLGIIFRPKLYRLTGKLPNIVTVQPYDAERRGKTSLTVETASTGHLAESRCLFVKKYSPDGHGFPLSSVSEGNGAAMRSTNIMDETGLEY